MFTKEQTDFYNEVIRKNFKRKFNEIIFFISCSKNSAVDSSDLDIAIILDKEIDRKSKLESLNQLWWETLKSEISADFIIKTLKDFDNDKILPTISKTINAEGTVIWLKH